MHLHLIFKSLTWDLSTTLYEDQETATTNYSGSEVKCAAVRGHVGDLAINLPSSLTTDLTNVTNNDNFYRILSSNYQILSIESSLNGHIRLLKIAPQTLAAQWMMSPDHAKCTVVMTTQRRVRTCLNPSLSHCSQPTTRCCSISNFLTPFY